MSKVTPAAILAALFVLIMRVGAQEPPPNPASVQPGPVIHTTASEVALDLVVRDKKGRLVKNLGSGDLEIYEDGVRQQIKSFRLVNEQAAPAPPAQPAQPASPGHPEQPPSGPAFPTVTLIPAAPNLVCIVFHNLDTSARKWAISAAQEFIANHLHPGTWVGIFNLDARLTSLHPFTTNRDELLHAANNAFYGTTADITRAAEAVLNSTPNVQFIIGTGDPTAYKDLSTTGSVAATAIVGADVDNGPGANSQRGDMVLEREQFIGVEGARQMDQINLMIRQIGAFPGHKSVLLLSSGFTTTGDPDQFQALLNKATLANLSVYAFDANGLNQTSTAQASTIALQHVTALSQQQGQISPGYGNSVPPPGTSSTGGAGVLAERSRQGDYQRDAVRTSDPQSGLRALSEGTGGFLVANSNDLRKPFQQIGGDVEAHYEADYHPSSDKYDGHFRKIEIKLARADWKVESRAGYFAIPDVGGSDALRPFEMVGLMLLNAHPAPRGFEFRSAAFQFRPGANAQSAVVFELPGTALTATPQPAQKKHRLHASLFAVVKDPDGEIVDRFGKDFLYEVPDDQLAGIQAAPIDYGHAFNLPPGHYTVESVLLDREANRASTSTVEFDSAAAKGVGLSSVVLVARADPLTGEPEPDDPLHFQGRELVPMFGGSVKPSAKPLVYFVVYPDKSSQEKPRIRVEFLVNGEQLEQKQDELPPPDSSGGIPVVVNAVTKPGNCEIRITAMQGFESTTRSVTYTVAAQ
jgi:VWFA-related protein